MRFTRARDRCLRTRQIVTHEKLLVHLFTGEPMVPSDLGRWHDVTNSI